MVWSADPHKFHLLAWNQNFKDYFAERGVAVCPGTSAEELFGGDAELWRQRYARAAEHGGFEESCTMPCGAPFDLSFQPLHAGAERFAITVTAQGECSEKWYRELFERAFGGIWRIAADGSALEVNPALASMLGYDSPQQMKAALPDAPAQIWADEADRHRLAAILERQESADAVECRLRRRDGSFRWVSVSVRRVRDGVGRTLYYEGAVEDIDARKKADEALRQSECRFRTLFQHAPQGIALMDQESGRFVEVNPAYCRITGRSAEEMTRTTFYQITHPDDVDWDAAQVERMRTRESCGFDRDKRYIRPDGSSVWVHISVTSFPEASAPPMHLAIVEDITARKQAEEALRRSEQKFADFFRFSPAIMAISELEPVARILEVNEAFEQATGVSRAEAMGRGGGDFWVDPEQRERVLREMLGQGSVNNLECEFRVREGKIHSGLLSGVRFEAEGRKHAIFVVVDVTEQKRAERRLQESEAKFRAIVENSHDGITFMDENTRVLYRSPALARLSGFLDEERMGREGMDLIHPDDLSQVRRAWQEALDHPERAHRAQYRLRHRDGSWRTAESSIQNFLGNPAVGVMLVTTNDISEQARAEEDLRVSETKLQETTRHFLAVAKCVPDVIWSMDLEGRFTYVSPAVERMYGYTVEEFLGITRAQTATPEFLESWTRLMQDEVARAMSPEYERGRVIAMEAERVRKDGTRFWAELRTSLISSDDGRPVGWTGISRDITERKQAEAEREKLWERLAQAQKMESVGRLAGGVAHDFNNLLTVINGYSQAAVAKMAADHPFRESMSEIYQAGQRAAALTRQLLAFSRKQILRLRPLDLNGVVRGMEPLLARLMGDDVEVRLETCAAKLTVMADAHQLEQAILNLAANARDVMPAGGALRISTRFEERTEASAQNNARAGRYAALDVSDTGIGMDAATMQRIFEPFFTTRNHGRGAGLRLSMVQGVVEQSGGFLTVESEPGRGTTFHICLAVVDEAGPETTHAPTTEAIESGRPRKTILVVEDQPQVQKFVAQMLRASGHRVLLACGGSEALAVCRDAKQIDLLLTDLIMPGLNGRELAAAIAELRPGIKTLFMSGYADDVVTRHGMGEEGVHFIHKPFEAAELVDRIRRLLEKPAE